MRDRNEYIRQLVHMAFGGCALLLRYLTWWQAASIAALAALFNLFLLPRLGGRHLYRQSDISRGFPAGIVLYPISVLLLILLFPARPDIAAAAWAVLAFGDGMATIAGRAIGGPRIPWNREKSWAGSSALFVAGAVTGALLAWWCRPAAHPPPMWFTLGAPVLAAFVAAWAESIPIRLDDNLSVPAAAALVLWASSLVSAEAARAALTSLWPALGAGALLNGAVAWAGYRARTVSVSGAICGAVIGTLIFAGAGWTGWLLLLATFAAAVITSRLGLRRKTLLGIAEERGGRRGASNALANTGIAAMAAMLALLTETRDAALLAFAAALAAGGSDTVASEIGKAWGRHAYLISTFRSVPPGTPGAVSIEGTAAGFVGALVLAGLAVSLGITPTAALVPLLLGATLGSLAESLLGATLEPRGILNNDLLNFLNTSIAAGAAVLLAGGGL